MTKKDFEFIADVIREMERDRPGGDDIRRIAAEAFATRLRLINPLFDRARFMKACGVYA